jgi:hypothetical protein
VRSFGRTTSLVDRLCAGRLVSALALLLFALLLGLPAHFAQSSLDGASLALRRCVQDEGSEGRELRKTKHPHVVAEALLHLSQRVERQRHRRFSQNNASPNGGRKFGAIRRQQPNEIILVIIQQQNILYQNHSLQHTSK